MTFKQFDAKTFYLNFWTGFNAFSEKSKLGLKLKKAPSRYYYEFFYRLRGSSRFSIYIYPKENEANCSLFIPKQKEIFYELLESKQQIENKLGRLDWQELPTKQASRIRQSKNIDLFAYDSRQMAFQWLGGRLVEFQAVLIPYLQ